VILRQVLEHAEHAKALCAQTELPGIVADWQKRLAFERVMELIGEAVKRLPAAMTQKYPAVPWSLIRGMRDRIAHGYDSIDYGTLWDAVQQDVPVLIDTVRNMIAEIEED
jgi:uncharacterized protein with HEPN domain